MSKGSYKYPTNPRLKLDNILKLVFSSDCQSGDSPALLLALKVSSTRVSGMSSKLGIHPSVQQQFHHSP